ncbi:hypothetical protein [Nocardia sp. NPDC057440]
MHDPALTDTFSGNSAVNNTWVTVAGAPVGKAAVGSACVGADILK